MILAGDHIYKMNYSRMVEHHLRVGADLTIGALRVEKRQACQFGVMQIDATGRVVGFDEKPSEPKTIPGDDQHCMASMGIYVFNSRFLFEQLCFDANQPHSSHDFGRDVIPRVIDRYAVYAFQFRDENRKQDAYWRDVGTLDAYYEANMDLVAVDPQLNMYDQHWPVRSYQPYFPPPKFVFNKSATEDRCGQALDSIVAQGSIISGGTVDHSVVGFDVRVNSYAHVQDSILFSGVEIGRTAQLRRAIVDKGVRIPAGLEIGFDLEEDRRRGFTVTESGIVVIAKGDAVTQMVDESASQVAS
jgi:glucose-1-phosphate adenylyltransferase